MKDLEGEIRAIEWLKDSPRKVRINLSSGDSFELSVDTYISSGLKKGSIIHGQQVSCLVHREQIHHARKIALRAISRRARSKAEVANILKSKGINLEVAQEVLDELEGEGLIDDETFLRDWIDMRMRTKPMGRVRLRQELMQKGIDRDLIEEGLGEVAREEEIQMALALARARLKEGQNIQDPTVQRRLSGFLQRRGFNADVILATFRKLGNPDL